MSVERRLQTASNLLIFATSAVLTAVTLVSLFVLGWL